MAPMFWALTFCERLWTSHKIYNWEWDRLTTHRLRVMKLTVHSPDLDKLNLLKLSYGWSFLCFKPVFLNLLVSKSRSMTNFWVTVPVQESFRLFSLNFTPKYKEYTVLAWFVFHLIYLSIMFRKWYPIKNLANFKFINVSDRKYPSPGGWETLLKTIYVTHTL